MAKRPLAILVVALFLAACGTATPSPSTSGPAGSTPSPAPSSTPIATPSPSPLAGAGLAWEALPIFFEQTPLTDGLTHLVAGPAGYVVWGPTASGTDVIASGSDFSSWGEAGTPGQFEGVTVEAMSAGPAGLVAVGHDAAGAARAWRSADGMTWSQIEGLTGLDGTVSDIAVYQGAYLAVGLAADGCTLRAWRSADGAAWQASQAFAMTGGTCGDNHPFLHGVRVGPTGLVAFGGAHDPGESAWTSSDGIAWTIHPQGLSLEGNVSGFTVGGPGYVAVGASGAPSHAMVWTSPDGATWTRTPDQPSLANADMADVRTLGDGTLVAVGWSSGSISDTDRFTAWTSTDGLTWQVSPAAVSSNDPGPHNDAASVTVRQLATDGSRLVAIGTGTNGVWVSPRVNAGLRTATLTVALSGRVRRTAGQAVGTCRAAPNDPAGTLVIATLAASDGTLYALDLTVTNGGQVAGFVFYGDPEVNVDPSGSGQLDAQHFTVAPGSTGASGSLDFSGLTDLSASGTAKLSGSVEWACGS